MKNRIQASMAVTLFVLALGGCADMTHQEKTTVGGAVIGGVAGSALTGGSTTGTVAGAVVGGVAGHEYGRDH